MKKNKTVTKKQKDNFYSKWDEWEKEAERRSAWNPYIMHVQEMNERRDDQLIINGNEKDREEILKKRKNRSNMLYIG